MEARERLARARHAESAEAWIVGAVVLVGACSLLALAVLLDVPLVRGRIVWFASVLVCILTVIW